MLLERAGDIEVVGEAGDGQEAVRLVRSLQPDVLVADISMPRLNGTQAVEQIKSARLNTQVVILSMHSDEVLVRQALRSGARGYLLKSSVSEELLLAVRAAIRGETYLSPAISSSIVSDFLAFPDIAEDLTPFDLLSPREREVLKLIAEGRTNNAIATALSVSIKTVEKHRANLMGKLNVHDMPGLIRIALKHGLIFLDE